MKLSLNKDISAPNLYVPKENSVDDLSIHKDSVDTNLDEEVEHHNEADLNCVRAGSRDQLGGNSYEYFSNPIFARWVIYIAQITKLS